MKTVNKTAQNDFISIAKSDFGVGETITRKQIVEICATKNLKFPNWLTNDTAYRTSKRGVYNINVTQPKAISMAAMSLPVAAPQMSGGLLSVSENESEFIPEKISGYVPFGHFNDVKTIVKSGIFYPLFVTGLSGNGKTLMIEQVHASLGKELIRANITQETDEDDLIGGFRMLGGQTVWQDGPVISAMKRGAGLLLDEIDLGSNKLMCLQPVLEGKAIFLKKTGRVVHPAKGFNVFATANTKGKGSDDGRFIGTNILNEAFLERFTLTFEQEYPENTVETKILQNVLSELEVEDSNFVEVLVKWASATRRAFKEQAISELISTRRLVHVCQAYKIFGGDRMKAVQLCVNRFDDDTKQALAQMYTKFDETVNPKAGAEPEKKAEESVLTSDDIPF